MLNGATTVMAQDQSPVDEAEKPSGIDAIHARISELVLRTANQIDAFYATDNFATWEDNQTSIRLRGNFDYLEHHGWDFGAGVRFNIVLPAINGRLRIVSNENEDGSESSSVSNFSDDAGVALRYIGIQRPGFALNFDAGVRVRDTAEKENSVAVYPRINIRRSYGLGFSWAGRSDMRAYYYSDTGGRVDLRQYFEHKLTEDLFFRSRFRLQWLEEEDSQLFPEIRLTTFQRLGSKSAIAYEVIGEEIPAIRSRFEDDEILVEPRDRYKQYHLRIRYRRNIKWPWFFVEAWPGIVWSEQRDYESGFEARLRFEIIFGHIPTAGALKLDEH
jgi:hypothetical protein